MPLLPPLRFTNQLLGYTIRKCCAHSMSYWRSQFGRNIGNESFGDIDRNGRNARIADR